MLWASPIVKMSSPRGHLQHSTVAVQKLHAAMAVTVRTKVTLKGEILSKHFLYHL